MKRSVTITLFIFWAAITAVFAAGLINYENSKNVSNSTPGIEGGGVSTTGQVGNTTGTSGNLTQVVLSKSEIANHNSAGNCWFLISGKVYDVTNFINIHPGGAGEILASCGKDATQAFLTRGGTGTHSSSAKAMLADYYIGDLNQGVPQSSVKAPANSTPTGNTSVSNSQEREDQNDD